MQPGYRFSAQVRLRPHGLWVSCASTPIHRRAVGILWAPATVAVAGTSPDTTNPRAESGPRRPFPGRAGISIGRSRWLGPIGRAGRTPPRWCAGPPPRRRQLVVTFPVQQTAGNAAGRLSASRLAPASSWAASRRRTEPSVSRAPCDVNSPVRSTRHRLRLPCSATAKTGPVRAATW